jgi:hypothetical protein
MKVYVSRWENHNQFDHILEDRRRNSNIFHVPSYKAADCDTDHYLVVAKAREVLEVHEQKSHRCHMERFNLKKLNEVEIVRSQIDLQLWKIWTKRWKLIVPGK